MVPILSNYFWLRHVKLILLLFPQFLPRLFATLFCIFAKIYVCIIKFAKIRLFLFVKEKVMLKLHLIESKMRDKGSPNISVKVIDCLNVAAQGHCVF